MKSYEVEICTKLAEYMYHQCEGFKKWWDSIKSPERQKILNDAYMIVEYSLLKVIDE